MSNCLVTLTGAITIGGSGCGCAGGSGVPNQKIQGLNFGCANTVYEAVVSNDCAQSIATAGVLGAVFAPLPVSGVGAFQLLMIKSTAPFKLRFNAKKAELTGTGGIFPTLFAGGETFSFTVDGTTVSGVFTAAAQSAAQVATELNQAAIAAGLSFLPFTVSGGQVKVSGALESNDGAVVANAGTGMAGIGFGTVGQTASGSATDSPVINGLYLVQFDLLSAPTKVQISGSAQIEVLAAGKAA